MKKLTEIILNNLESEKLPADYLLTLNKLCEKEDEFLKDCSKEFFSNYFDLDLLKIELHGIYLEYAIDYAIEFLKKIED